MDLEVSGTDSAEDMSVMVAMVEKFRIRDYYGSRFFVGGIFSFFII